MLRDLDLILFNSRSCGGIRDSVASILSRSGGRTRDTVPCATGPKLLRAARLLLGLLLSAHVPQRCMCTQSEHMDLGML